MMAKVVSQGADAMDLYRGRFSYVDQWPLMSSPLPLIMIITTYLLFVLKIGPHIMQYRSPYKIRAVLVIYNGLQVINSVWIVILYTLYALENGIILRECNTDENFTQHRVVTKYMYIYLLTKVADLFDTVFFVLRKKYSQVTFLHLYHHCIMVVGVWLSLKYDPSDSWLFLGLANCFIHSIMYSYYGLAAMGPRFKKYLWWKKYLTKMQLLQFLCVMIHIYIQTNVTKCPVSGVFYWLVLLNGVLFLYLFMDFYFKSYNLSQKKDKKQK